MNLSTRYERCYRKLKSLALIAFFELKETRRSPIQFQPFIAWCFVAVYRDKTPVLFPIGSPAHTIWSALTTFQHGMIKRHAKVELKIFSFKRRRSYYRAAHSKLHTKRIFGKPR